MGRYLSWLANAVLLGICCFLAANVANTVFAALLTPAPGEVAPAAVPAPVKARSWADRKVVLDRNLFESAVAAPRVTVVEPEPESLEATKLPLDLLGTVCSENEDLAWAAVQDRSARKHLILQRGDSLGGGQATLERIECRRIVLLENGKLRELALAEGVPTLSTASPRVSSAPRSRTDGRVSAKTRRAERRAKLAEVRKQAAEAQKQANEARAQGTKAPVGSMQAAAKLFSEAQILPRYEDGRMIGVQLNGIQSGSTFERMGFQDGEVITQLNDIEISSPEESARVLNEFAESTEFTITTLDADGNEVTREVSLEPDE